jgi:hypothetical protein
MVCIDICLENGCLSLKPVVGPLCHYGGFYLSSTKKNGVAKCTKENKGEKKSNLAKTSSHIVIR